MNSEQMVYLFSSHATYQNWQDHCSVLLEKMSVDIDATPDLLLLIQQKLLIVQYWYGSLSSKSTTETPKPGFKIHLKIEHGFVWAKDFDFSFDVNFNIQLTGFVSTVDFNIYLDRFPNVFSNGTRQTIATS